MKRLPILVILLLACLSNVAWAQPGTILFSDDFERAVLAPNWATVDPANADLAGINGLLVSAGSSAFVRGDTVDVESIAIDLSSVGGADITAEFRKGLDAAGLSEDPDAADEDFMFEFLADDNVTWVVLTELSAVDLADGENVSFSTSLPFEALHANFRLRLRLEGGSGGPPANGGLGFDFWHADDIVVTETGFTLPPPPLTANTCEEFENGLGNFTQSDPTFSGISDATFNTPSNSLFLNGAPNDVTSVSFNATNVNSITLFVQQGDDAFSENPEAGEDLVFEFLNPATGVFEEIDTFPGAAAAGTIFNETYTLADFTPSANFQVRFRLTAGSGAPFDFWHIDSLCFLGGDPAITLLKSLRVESDPENGTSNPKAIPGAEVRYTIMASNSGDGSTDFNSIVIRDTLDPNLTLFTGDLDGSGSPFVFVDGNGSAISGLAYEFISLGSTLDSPIFRNSGGTAVTPVTDFDPSIRSFEIELRGAFNPQNIATPQFQLQYRVRIE